jgi:hypothetical protein
LFVLSHTPATNIVSGVLLAARGGLYDRVLPLGPANRIVALLRNGGRYRPMTTPLTLPVTRYRIAYWLLPEPVLSRRTSATNVMAVSGVNDPFVEFVFAITYGSRLPPEPTRFM